MKKKLKHIFEYIIIRILYTFILLLPFAIIKLIARMGSFIFERLLKYRSAVIDRNLFIAFPDKTEEQRTRIKKNFYKHITLFFLEFIKGPKISDTFLNSKVINESETTLSKFKDKPFILVTAHYGEFNLFLMKVTQFIQSPLHIIMKEQRNPYSNKFMMDQRVACNQVPHLSKGALRSTMKALAKKEHLGFLNDQNAGDKGIDVTFFGEVASTMTGLAAMKEKFEYPILQGYCCRDNKGAYRFWIDELSITKKDGENKDEYYKRILQTSNDHLEKAIHRYPDQYLWSHKRWKVDY